MKRGFTLIELLVIIAILGLLSVIIVPRVMDAVDESEQNLVKESATTVIKAANIYSLNNGYNTEINITDGTLDFGGKVPDFGYVIINEDEEAQLYMYLNEYCVTKAYSGEININKTSSGNCTWNSVLGN